jgi:23S rRNA (uracil1939-C5)-methyltransferase
VAAPVARNEELELRVDSLAYGGNGVARLNGFVVFVRRGLPGDTVRARVTKVKRGYAEATATEVLVPSPERTDAPCKHYHEGCGGCRFQDLRYEAQIAAKEAQVRDALARIGGFAEPAVEPILPAEEQFHYRNKLEYSFTQTAKGAALGFHRAGRWDEVLEVDRCWLTTDLGNGIRDAVRDWAQEEGLPPYDQEAQRGYLRHLVVREGRNTGQALVQLVTAPWLEASPAKPATPGRKTGPWLKASPAQPATPGRKGVRDLQGADRFVAALREFPAVRSIHWAVNDSPAEVTNLPTHLLWGEEAIEETFLGLRFRVRPNAFLQTNTRMAARLYELAIEYAGLSGNETVYDLYCGIGTIGLVMASRARTVWGVETNEESVACAIENAGLNGITNAAFFAGEVGASLEELADRAGPPDVAVVDPPRAGLSGKALRRLARLEAPTIVYVSCNPTTLAGNLKELAGEWGYTLRRVKPVDMFPHTPHVESVALLTRGSRRRPGT